ncbi:Flp family type IVb pilin [Vibrio sp. SS-MA-C1-2]|uniref:Flp family type IVb pilin n=1 Tax=Vibrio sp. SS-MA-C1-2 TaxID=2908646 RepID=UPI001F361B16|nr:Flp family type IVb pilin [Vibrio sp. SS-MA-C1-2]UJF17521.1 Flp family type IVb pilin [Vibrio sp. SS-MA-C1-2]
MNKLKTFLNSLKSDQRGVTAIEYGLIAVALAAALVIIAPRLTESINSTFESIETDLGSAGTAPTSIS